MAATNAGSKRYRISSGMFGESNTHPTPKAWQLDVANLALAYSNSLLFSALFSFDSVWVFLVRGVFNGLGILMVLGLLSVIVGQLITYFKPSNGGASHYTNIVLLIWQAIFGAMVLATMVV